MLHFCIFFFAPLIASIYFVVLLYNPRRLLPLDIFFSIP
jgi:hypothetical protein